MELEWKTMVRMSGSTSKEKSMSRSLGGPSKVRQRGKLTIRNQEPDVSALGFMILLPRKGELQV